MFAGNIVGAFLVEVNYAVRGPGSSGPQRKDGCLFYSISLNLSYSLTHFILLAHSLTPSLTHSLNQSHSITHSLTFPPIHSLTHRPTPLTLYMSYTKL